MFTIGNPTGFYYPNLFDRVESIVYDYAEKKLTKREMVLTV